MKVYCITENRDKRSDLLRWLSRNSSIRFAGGSGVFPVPELAGISGPALVSADDGGLSVVLFSRRPAQYGQRVTVAEFAAAVRENFPAAGAGVVVESEKSGRPSPAQLSIGGASW